MPKVIQCTRMMGETTYKVIRIKGNRECNQI